MRRSSLALLLAVPAACLLALAYRSYASPELGLVARYVEELDGAPILAGIYDNASKRTFEYTAGDYVKGLLVRQVLKDRVVLVDEVTKYQYVLVVNELETDDEAGEVDVIRLKRRKRDLDDMDVTSEFNREMAKAEGTYRLFGAGGGHDAAESQAKAERRSEPLGGQREETMPRSPLRDRRPNDKDDKKEDEKGSIPSAVTPFIPKVEVPKPLSIPKVSEVAPTPSEKKSNLPVKGLSSGNNDNYDSSRKNQSEQWVDSYTRKDGVEVKGHWKTKNDGNKNNNYSTKGNVNPHTGKKGTK